MQETFIEMMISDLCLFYCKDFADFSDKEMKFYYGKKILLIEKYFLDWLCYRWTKMALLRAIFKIQKLKLINIATT